VESFCKAGNSASFSYVCNKQENYMNTWQVNFSKDKVKAQKNQQVKKKALCCAVV
jgi:hypothetical protein